MSEKKYNEQFDLSKFIGYDSSILEELYKERPPPSISNYDDFLKLPVNPDYEKNQKTKQLEEKKDLDNSNE